MSDTEDEVGQQEELEQDYDSIFQFFFQLTKPLLLELPSPEDRTLAAVWIRRLEMQPETDEEKRLRVDYLKLLLFVMQRGRLIGIFKNEPPPGPLQPFPEGLGLIEMGNFLLEQAELQGSGDADARKVTYNVEISNDLREFVAAQEIPDFGIQVYYAWSVEDPIYKWMSFDETRFPQHVRDKIRQLKIVKSEERINTTSGSLRGEKTDSSLRKTCDSALYDKNRAKVKSPEEIEKSLERNHHSFTNYPTQRESDDEDLAGGTRRGGSKLCYSENAVRHKSKCHPHSNRKRDADMSKRLQDCCHVKITVTKRNNPDDTRRPAAIIAGQQQPMPLSLCHVLNALTRKCDDAVENRSPQMNEPSYMAGPSQKMNDKCHGKEMYSESARCGGEAGPPPKPPCSSPRGYQMNQSISMPPVKSRKSRCTAQAYENQQEDPSKKCICASTMKPSSPAKSQCSCPCPKEEREIPCFKKKEKSQLEKTCSKPKTPCPEPMAAKRPQEQQPCPDLQEGLKPCSRKMHAEAPEGCTCGDDRPKHQSENVNRIGREKAMNEMCPQEVAPQQQKFSCPRKKGDRRDKRQTEQPEEPMPGSCSKNRVPNAEDQMKRRPEAFKEPCAPQRSPQAVNPSCYQQAMKLQDNRGPDRPFPGEYAANGLGACSRNQDPETKMHGRRAREGEYMDKRCETEIKDVKYSQRQGQEYPGNDHVPCTGKRMPAHPNYSCAQEPVPQAYKNCNNFCTCGLPGQNLNGDEELGDNASFGSEENFPEECDGQNDVGVDPNNNPEEECQPDYGLAEEGNAACSSSAENVSCHDYNFYEGTSYLKPPPKIHPDFGLNEFPNKYAAPGCGPCPGAEQPLPQQPARTPFKTPVSKPVYPDNNYTLPSRRKKFPDPRDFPICNKVESLQNHNRYVITSTPAKESALPLFAHSPVSTIPQSRVSRCGQWEQEDEYMPLHMMSQRGRTYSIHKDSPPGRRKKTSQELECSRGPSSQLQYATLTDDDPNENQDASRGMHCNPGNLNDQNFNQQPQKWSDHQWKTPHCYYRRPT